MISLAVDQQTGKLSKVTFNGTTHEISQELMYYEGAQGDNSEFERRASGAYIFRPSPEKPDAVTTAESVNITTYKGQLFQEIHQEYNEWLTQVIRIYQEENYVEFDWIVGPIYTE